MTFSRRDAMNITLLRANVNNAVPWFTVLHIRPCLILFFFLSYTSFTEVKLIISTFYVVPAWATVGKKSVRKNMILVHILSFDSDEVGTSSLF